MALFWTFSAAFEVVFLCSLICLRENDAFAVPEVRVLAKLYTLSTTFLCATRDEVTPSSVTSVLQEGLDKMEKVMAPDFDGLSSLYSQCSKLVEIKESSISGAGLGLFAKKNIKANTIVCFYPAHALGIDVDEDNDKGGIPSNGFVSNGSDQEYFATHSPFKSSYLHCTDQPLFQRTSLLQQAGIDNVPLFLDVNPNRPIINKAWVSQMINDGATVQANTKEGVLEYYQESGKLKNCIHIPFGPSPIMATATTTKVKKGQELLTSYGGTYWLGVLHDLHGEEGVAVTPAIQARIQETARDLQKSMQSVAIVYANHLEFLEAEFNKL